MRAMSMSYAAVASLLLACGSGAGGDIFNDAAGASAGTNTSGEDGMDGEAHGGASGAEWNGELAPAFQIASGEASLLGVTGDGWAVFRGNEMLLAASLTGDEATKELTPSPGSVLIRGRVVFNWAEVDWMKGVGQLSISSIEGGSHELGSTPYVEALVAASPSGKAVVYPAATTATTTDLMIAPSDFSSPQVLIPALGLGSEATCGANIGFVGERLFVGWCPENSRAARLERFENTGEGWTSTLIAEGAQPTWSADESGERVFYQSGDYGGLVAEAGQSTAIDAGVGRGQIVPDGSAVLYTVGDQLRRSAFPNVNPVPIVTTGYKQPIGFSSAFDLALYSTTITYETGTRQDLLLVSTQGLNTDPIELVGEPVAALGRSTMTADGRFVFYLTDMSDTGSTLHVAAQNGSEMLSVPNVTEVLAATDSTLVFSDNPSAPDQYPVVADLKVLNLARETEPRLIEEKILDGRNFHLDASRAHVVYVRSGVDRDAESPESKGLFVREIK